VAERVAVERTVLIGVAVKPEGKFERFGAVILCGGSSRRMGRPKLWLPWGSELMVQRVARRMLAAVPHVALAAAAGQTIPRLPDDVDVVRDERPQRGPLEGLRVGLLWARRKRLEAVFAAACDMPLLKPELVRATLEQLADADAALWSVHGRIQPLAAAYRVRIIGQLQDLLARGGRSMMELVKQLRCNVLPTAKLESIDPQFESFLNVNTFEQYRELLAARGNGA